MTAQETLHRWPDLSDYGLYFGILTVPSGHKRLIMLDETGMFEDLGNEMKFSKTKWAGLWARADLNFTIPNAKTRFPKVKVVQKSSAEIIGDIRDRLVARQTPKTEERRYSWRSTAPAPSAVSNERRISGHAESTSEAQGSLPSAAAMAQILFLGTNHAGQRVFESADGARFTRAQDSDVILTQESDSATPSAIFLRAQSDEDFSFCARGLIHDIENGHILKSEDFERYLSAISGPEALNSEEAILRFQQAIDQAMISAVHNKGRGEAAYQYACSLHDGRPPYFRPKGTYPTPLPIAILLQHLSTVSAPVAEGDDSAELAALDVGGGHSWTYGNAAILMANQDIPAHTVAIGGVFGEPMTTVTHAESGVRISRTDHQRMLDLVVQRAPEGTTALIINAGEHCGKLSPEFRRVLSWIGMHYHVLGLADIPDTLVAPGSGVHSRLLVVGSKRPAPDITWSVPAHSEVIHDYDSLWKWGHERVASKEDPDAFFGESVVATNRWQVPYIPASQCSEPETMAPRNLLGPVRKALFNVTESVGMGVDEYVASQLQIDLDRLPQLLSAEQVDAVALIVHSWQKNGFINADQTGIGKGRVLAAVARYAKLNGYNVMFVTESKDLLQDFYRDLSHVDTFHVFDRPSVIPQQITIVDEETHEPVLSSMSSIERARLLESGGMSDCDLVLATYSQFNRKPPEAHQFAKHQAAQNIIAGLDLTNDIESAIVEFDHAFHHNTLGTVLPAARTDLTKPEDAILAAIDTYEAGLSEEERGQREHALKNARKLVLMTEGDIRAQCKRHILSMTELRQHWITTADFSRTFLLLDESHNAAGPTAQVNANLLHAVETSAANVNSSATFAREKKNFGLYRRVFPARLQANIEEIVRKGGEPVQEVIAAMLCADGRMIRREHDLSCVDFLVSVDERNAQRNEQWMDSVARAICFMARISNEVHESVLEQNLKHDAAFENTVSKAARAHLEQTLGKDAADNLLNNLTSINLPAAKNAKQMMATAAEAARTSIPRMGVGYTNFSSRFFNLNRALMLAVAADHTADNAIKALESGRKPVIAVESTMQSVILDLVAVDDDVELTSISESDFDRIINGDAADPGDAVAGDDKQIKVYKIDQKFGFRDLLRRQADRLFSTIQYEKKNGRIVRAIRQQVSLTPERQAALDTIHQLIDEIPADVPISPLDVVRKRITEAGYSVGEISGRSHELVDLPDGQILRPIRKAPKQEVKDDFNSGRIDAVILSRSGSTGISLHSYFRYADQRPRELIEMQPANDILQRLQFWGRVNRKGQVNHPTIRLQSSNLPSEKRLLALQINSLRALSANVTGNADNSAIDCSIPDIINAVGNEICFRYLETNPDVAQTLGIKVGNLEESVAERSDTFFVNQLTAKIIMLPTADGNRVLDHIFKEFESVINEHNIRGTNPLQPARYDIRAKTIRERPVPTFMHEGNGTPSVFDMPLVAKSIEYTKAVAGHSLEKIGERIRDGKGDVAYFHRQKPNFHKDVEQIAASLGKVSLPNRFNSVEAALADEAPNAVKSLYDRANWLVNNIDTFVPGTIIEIDGIDGKENLLITEFHPPYLGFSSTSSGGWTPVKKGRSLEEGDGDKAREDGNSSDFFGGPSEADVRAAASRHSDTNLSSGRSSLISLAMYDVGCLSASRTDSITLTYSSIYNMQDSVTVLVRHDDPDYKTKAKPYFDEITSPIPVRSERIVLTGNVIEACAVMRQLGHGTVATFSSDRGVWEHGVVMPATFSSYEFNHLPVVVSDADMMMKALVDDRRIFDGDTKDSVFIIDPSRKGRGNGIWMILYGAASKHTNVMTRPEVQNCLDATNRWDGSRARREAMVLPGKEAEFCAAILAALRADGHQVLVKEGSAWLAGRNKALAAQKAAAAKVHDDLDALMTSNPTTPEMTLN